MAALFVSAVATVLWLVSLGLFYRNWFVKPLGIRGFGILTLTYSILVPTLITQGLLLGVWFFYVEAVVCLSLAVVFGYLVYHRLHELESDDSNEVRIDDRCYSRQTRSSGPYY